MKRGHEPVRMCVICRTRAPQQDLQRHTAQGGILLPDTAERKPGRGWYVCADEKCREKLARYRAGKRKK